MITVEQYFGPWINHPSVTDEIRANAERLVSVCGLLEQVMLDDGIQFPDNPATHTGVSGKLYGGYRPPECTQGAPHSSHKQGLAVDRFDPNEDIDRWLLSNQERLAEFGIYIEHPDDTHHWSHWSVKPPASGHHVFKP